MSPRNVLATTHSRKVPGRKTPITITTHVKEKGGGDRGTPTEDEFIIPQAPAPQTPLRTHHGAFAWDLNAKYSIRKGMTEGRRVEDQRAEFWAPKRKGRESRRKWNLRKGGGDALIANAAKKLILTASGLVRLKEM